MRNETKLKKTTKFREIRNETKISCNPGCKGRKCPALKKYTAIPEIWKLWIVQEYYYSDIGKVLKEISLTHFFDENFLIFIDDDYGVIISRKNRKFSFVISYPYFHCIPFILVKNTKEFWNEIDYALTFPHYYLKNLYYYFDEFSDSYPSERIKKLSKIEKLFQKLMAAFDNDDIEKWFNLLVETENHDIIIQNMEYYISKKPYEKEAWKKYIYFLAEINFNKAMLGVYSRYCRFFLDDNEMKKEYFEKVIQLHQNGEDVKIWFFDSKEILLDSNLIHFYDIIVKENTENMNELMKACESFETLKVNYEKRIDGLDCLEDADLWFMNDELNFLKTFDTDIFVEKTVAKPFNVKNIEDCKVKWKNSNMIIQSFAFRENILHYISQNYGLRQKLYQCCKYFFTKFRNSLCHFMFVIESSKIKFSNQRIFLPLDLFNNDLHNHFLNDIRENMTLTTSLHIINNLNSICFTQIFKSFKNINIKYIALNSQTVNLQDLILLNQNCHLISCSLIDTDVIDFDGNFSSVENVITNLPTLKKFMLQCPNLKYTKNTAKKLANISPEQKFQEFTIMCATEKFQCIDFCDFLKRHTLKNCKFEIDFYEAVNNDYSKAFFQTVCKCLDSWEPKHYAPSFLLPKFPLYYNP